MPLRFWVEGGVIPLCVWSGSHSCEIFPILPPRFSQQVPLPPQVIAHMAIMVPTTEILKPRDKPRMTSSTIVRYAHIVVEGITQLMKENYSIYGVH